MRKAAILSFAASYLLISTGVYVCLMHCAVANFLNPKAAYSCSNACRNSGKMRMANAMQCHDNHSKKPSKKTADCCKVHGNYVVKENIKPYFCFYKLNLDVGGIPFTAGTHISRYKNVNIVGLQVYTKAPPPFSAKIYLIQIRKLLI